MAKIEGPVPENQLRGVASGLAIELRMGSRVGDDVRDLFIGQDMRNIQLAFVMALEWAAGIDTLGARRFEKMHADLIEEAKAYPVQGFGLQGAEQNVGAGSYQAPSSYDPLVVCDLGVTENRELW